MKTALKMKITLKMDIPQNITLENVEDLSEVKRTLKWRHILRFHYDRCHTSFFGMEDSEKRCHCQYYYSLIKHCCWDYKHDIPFVVCIWLLAILMCFCTGIPPCRSWELLGSTPLMVKNCQLLPSVQPWLCSGSCADANQTCQHEATWLRS